MTFNANLQQNSTRFLFIDGLRGLAAISVVSYHFYVGSPLQETLTEIFPKPFIFLLEEGRLGVEVFFVISGFVIAYSLRKTATNSQNLKRFICRFLIRLTPSYWSTIFLTIIINLTSNFVLTDRIAPIPSLKEIVAHLFYLQNVFDCDQIVPVFWTLCFEVRFYFLFATLLYVTHLIAQKSNYLKRSAILLGVFAPFGLLSISLNYQVPTGELFLSNWYMFLLGAIVCWVFEGKIKLAWLWIYTVLVGVTLFPSQQLELIAVLSTGYSIYFAAQYEQLYNWLNFTWLQYFGKISYSLYLIHLVTGMRLINIGYRINHDSELLSFFLFIIAFAVSTLSAHTLYFLVEKPSMIISKKIR